MLIFLYWQGGRSKPVLWVNALNLSLIPLKLTHLGMLFWHWHHRMQKERFALVFKFININIAHISPISYALPIHVGYWSLLL